MSNSEDAWNSLIVSSHKARNSVGYYEDLNRARQYNSSKLIWEDANQRVSLLKLEESWSVLEIGPGPGVMTIPLAKKVKSITVVEPSSSMIQFLAEHIKVADLSNIEIIHSNWEAVSKKELGFYDLVLASYCLDMMDIRSSLEKMCSCATREVHLWWFMGVTYWEKIRCEINPGIGISTPKADLLMDILIDMGYAPELEILDGTSFPNRYERIEDASNRMKSILSINEDDPLPDKARIFIEEHWKKTNGTYEYEDSTTYVHITVPMAR